MPGSGNCNVTSRPGSYQKIIIVSTASRLIPTARRAMITASSISMRLFEGMVSDVKGCEFVICISGSI